MMHSSGMLPLELVPISRISIAALAGTIVAFWLRRLQVGQREGPSSVREVDLSFHTIAQAVPAILWTARRDGSVDFLSPQLYHYSGFTQEQGAEWSWKTALHPDDLSVWTERWEHCIRTGDAYEIEYRLRRSDGAYRWFLGRANPVGNDQGQIIKWIGTCTDIEDQKHNQQMLEQQIRERTEELADANTKLQEEMWERDLARRELDQQNEKMLHELTARSQRATLLAKMGELLQSCINRDEVFGAALGFAPKIFPTSRGAVFLLNSARSLAEVAGQWHDCQIPAPVFEFLLGAADGTPAPRGCRRHHRTLRSCRWSTEHLPVYPNPGAGRGAWDPSLSGDRRKPRPADSELSFKTTFAGQVGLSVANIRLREALRSQSIKDPLTGLYNRRYLTEMLDRETRRAVRAEQALGILMLDLDHFKKFNDTYGHDAGDSVLRETASFLSKSVRGEDVVCRFGREEFVVILPTADLNAAHARAERIRSKLRELTVLHQGQSLGMITVSVGVAVLPEHGTAPQELLDAADAALYRAKREGRDRVVNAAPLPVVEAQPVAIEFLKP